MALETPSIPPPFIANAILNFHFDFLNPSLINTICRVLFFSSRSITILILECHSVMVVVFALDDRFHFCHLGKTECKKIGTKTNRKIFTTLGQYLNGFILHFSSFFSSPTSSFRRWEIVRFFLSFLQTYLQHGFIYSTRKSAWFLTF